MFYECIPDFERLWNARSPRLDVRPKGRHYQTFWLEILRGERDHPLFASRTLHRITRLLTGSTRLTALRRPKRKCVSKKTAVTGITRSAASSGKPVRRQ